MENYEGQNLVGEGSFGRVYKAIDKRNNQVVALKVIRKQGRSSKELQSFQRECEIQQHLRHPNIILMLDSFDTSSVMVVVTEFAHRDLHGILREGSLEENQAQKLTWDLVSALYYLHSHRILHRDLKPQNILLDLNGRAKLCDFGLARNMTAGTHVLTSIKGTPLYMAPELMAEQPYDYLADFWSLGCIIYETLVGETPFYSTSILQLVRKLRHDNVRWPSIISETCVSFLQGLLQKDPLDRMTWAAILEHPFVNDHVIILEEEIPESPFTHPLSASQSKTKERQHSLAKEHKPIHQTSSSTENDCKFIETSHVLPAEEVSKRASFSFCTSDSVIVHDTQSVRDSLKTQEETSEVETMSDIEGLQIVKKVSTDVMTNYKFNHKQQVLNLNVDHISVLNPYARFSTSNLVVTKMNSNKDTNLLDANTISPNVITLSASDRNNKVVKQQTPKLNKSDLQKRKLSQNLDNFSLKLGQADADFSSGKLLANGSEAKVTKSVVRSKSDLVHSKHKILPKDKVNKCVNSLTDKVFNMRLNESISSTKKSKRVVQNLLNDANILPISESVDNNATSDYINECSKTKIQSNGDTEIVNVLTESNAVKEPLNNGDEAKDFEGPVLPLGVAWEDSERPLENDEWLAFLNKTMLEVIDGEIDSFKEQNFVSIIVSPLRHHGVSSEVARSVANLLALPLVVPRTNQSVLSSIRNVYLEVKLVPNLIYASVLLCGRRHMSALSVDNSLEAHSFIQKQTCRSLTELSVADLQALESINLLVCHLVLCGEYFTSQFCDAIVVLSAKPLIQGFLDLAKRNTRLACDVLAVLNNTLCVLPENAELVVGIVLDGGIELLVKLLAHPDVLIKTRTCILLKLLGHFSCNSLQTYWCPELQNALENLLADSSQNVASVAGDVIAELKTLSFYEQLTN